MTARSKTLSWVLGSVGTLGARRGLGGTGGGNPQAKENPHNLMQPSELRCPFASALLESLLVCAVRSILYCSLSLAGPLQYLQ